VVGWMAGGAMGTVMAMMATTMAKTMGCDGDAVRTMVMMSMMSDDIEAAGPMDVPYALPVRTARLHRHRYTLH
jgi:hypothetical protein